MPKTTRTPKPTPTASADAYRHPEATNLLRPDVGTQPYFPKSKRKPPTRYRYDSSLSPELAWDGGNAARELGEWLIGLIASADLTGLGDLSGLHEFRDAHGEVVARVRTVQEAAELLAAIARPFLNWAGKAERLSFDVPTLPLFVHERLSTQAILETLTATAATRSFRSSTSSATPTGRSATRCCAPTSTPTAGPTA